MLRAFNLQQNHCWSPNYGNQFSIKYACKYIRLIYEDLIVHWPLVFVKLWVHNFIMVTIMLVNIKLTQLTGTLTFEINEW